METIGKLVLVVVGLVFIVTMLVLALCSIAREGLELSPR